MSAAALAKAIAAQAAADETGHQILSKEEAGISSKPEELPHPTEAAALEPPGASNVACREQSELPKRSTSNKINRGKRANNVATGHRFRPPISQAAALAARAKGAAAKEKREQSLPSPTVTDAGSFKSADNENWGDEEPRLNTSTGSAPAAQPEERPPQTDQLQDGDTGIDIEPTPGGLPSPSLYPIERNLQESIEGARLHLDKANMSAGEKRKAVSNWKTHPVAMGSSR